MSDSGATERAREPTASRAAAEPEPDVLLDVPELSVDEIRLTVDGLDADLSLRARLANLLQLDAGVRVHLEGVELDITGVRAEALLKVRLEKLVQILDRALTTIDRNPQLIDALARSVGVTVDDVHRAAGQVVDRTGQQVTDVGEVVDRAGRPVAGRVEPPVTAGMQTREPSGEASSGKEALAERTGGPGLGGGPGPGGDAARAAAGSGGDAGSAGDAGSGRGAESAGDATPGGGAGVGGAGTALSSGAGAAQVAGQAGETLRQAGRSVWEAIQSGMSQRRQQRPGR
ncbi:hypothetical protein [Micromonospora sp. DT227]|uniref:hypothetical protein n=1 Tax=Micromonospora sp. DT227 TaxID=3393433 RepID=UPI003CF277A3